jgi:CRISPR-associated protein Cmr2
MSIDYFADISQNSSDVTTLEHFITRYFQLKALGMNKDADALKDKWKKESTSTNIDVQQFGILWDLIQYPKIKFAPLPQYSFLLQFKFVLDKPYISRDEQDFYIIDNPIRKDKVFGLPYIAPSSWKGSLRAALWQLGRKAEADDEETRRIFGNERSAEEQKELRAGRLHLFPTFFTKKSLEIINPHDRERRVGTIPILMESVPKDTIGLFTILYVPFDLIGKEEKEVKKQVAGHIRLICEGLKAMFLHYGFGAKTSSGHGIAKPELVEGKLILKAKGIDISKKEEEKPKPPEESFMKYLNEDYTVKKEFLGKGKGGLLSSKEVGELKQKVSGFNSSEFQRFRDWYIEDYERWKKYVHEKDVSTSDFPKWTFKNFDELMKKVQEIESALNASAEGTL